MSKLRSNYSSCQLFSMADTYGEIQIVASPGRVACDVLSRNYDVAGHLHKDHALLNLPLPEAMRLNRLLAEAIEIALDSSAGLQPGLWSNTAMQSAAADLSSRRLAR